MHIYEINRPLFSLPDAHPAHRFLRAFIRCRRQCVGREIALPGDEHDALDQEWYSSTDDRTWTFSAFAYTFLSFDVELDGWLTDSPHLTETEKGVLDKLPYLRALLSECETAAVDDKNADILTMIEQVRSLFDLWENCITARLERTQDSKNSGQRSG
ncbi:MAG: hypothetical protein ACYTG0_05045 [Planctomycetota bacterium]|jgi:hypothetical protein